MRIIKKPADPIAVRISAGGVPGVGNYYLVYRGTLTEVIIILKDALDHIENIKEEPEINMDEFIQEG